MIVTIIGLGLIGGSIALDLKKRKFADKVIGVDNNLTNSNTAIKLGLVDKIEQLDTAIHESDLIIVSTPVNATKKLIPYLLDRIDKQTITDMGSTKASIIAQVENHIKRKQYVAAHPMSGTEFSGPRAAFSGLFDGKCSIICNREDSCEKSVNIVLEMFRCLKMKSIFMASDVHDRQTAYVSHLSHISAFALSRTVLHKEKKDKHIFELASGGFDSTVRLAKSSAEMWTPIFQENKKNISKVLSRYIDSLKEFKTAIDNDDLETLNILIKESNDIKRILDKKDNDNILSYDNKNITYK